VRDRVTGLDVPTAGCRTLDGDEGLALVRSRHLQFLVDGRWRSDPTGDLGRIERQQAFLVAALADAAEARGPATVRRLLDAAADHLTIDAGLSTDDLVGLGRDLAGLGGRGLTSLQLPVRNERVGSAAVLVADPAEARAVGADLDGSPTPARTGGVTVDRPFLSPGVTPQAACDK